ncbi:MAG: cell division protein FtsI [Lachnospiraceae bacterium]|nr:cell division protein FtsI [Lachnospiraceae bacterium]
MKKKLLGLLCLVLAAFLGLLYRIVQINRDNGDSYKKQVLSQQSYDSKVLPYKRGSIEDRNGSIFAYSEKVYNVIIDAKLANQDNGAHLDATMDALRQSFPELDIKEVRDYIALNPGAQYKKFLKRVPADRVAVYKEIEEASLADEEAEESSKVAKNAVWFEEEYVRKYPYDSVACDIIGFVQGDNTGQYGLEEYYNDTLNGSNGREYGFLNNDGSLERTIKKATDGCTIVSTVDVNIQSIVEKHIREFADKYKNNFRTGPAANNIGCIVMNPNTGEILSMANYPVFNLNDPRNMEGIDLSPYESLVKKKKKKKDEEEEEKEESVSEDEPSGEEPEEEQSEDDKETEEETEKESEEEAAEEAEEETEEENLYDSEEIKNAVWKNFCISDTFEPGSTVKPFTVAAAKDAGRISGWETYECNGALEVGQHVIHCHNRFGDGLLTVKEGIAKSCNVVLMDVAFALKKDDWLKYNKNFNFGLKTNIDLAGEVNGAETTFNEKMGLTDLAVASFGQGFNATMIQMAAGFSALINGGYYYQPHVVSRVLNPEGAVKQENNPRIVKQVISNETSDMIRDFCNAVVMSDPQDCTGWSARPAGYTMGGKTGTAEKLPRSAKNYVISFIGYVPAENPEVLAYVVIDTPNVEEQSESTRLATTLCRDIMTEVLRYMNIFPTLEISEEEQAELDKMLEDFSAGAVSQNAVSGNSVSENEAPEGEGDDAEPAMEPVEPSENRIQYDPETGYPLDPNTGEVLDPVTGQPIDKTLPSDLEF